MMDLIIIRGVCGGGGRAEGRGGFCRATISNGWRRWGRFNVVQKGQYKNTMC